MGRALDSIAKDVRRRQRGDSAVGVDLTKLSEELLTKLAATIAQTIREKGYKDVDLEVRQLREVNEELKRR